MAAPTVLRPLAQVEQENQQPSAAAAIVPYLKWVVLLAVVFGLGALAVVAVLTYKDRARRDDARAKSDQVYLALKDKTKPEEQIAALEGVSESVKGSTAHAQVLMSLGQLYFDESQKMEKAEDVRKTALKNSIKCFETVATQEPYKSNLAFGPQAVLNLAAAHEQAGDYDKAIETLKTAVDGSDVKHYLYNKTVAELGRIYYLRSLKSPEGSVERKKDGDLAYKNLEQTLKEMTSALEGESKQGDDQQYVKYLSYIKSLVSKSGKALLDGKVPPAKVAPVTEVAVPIPAAAAPTAPVVPKIEEKKEELKK